MKKYKLIKTYPNSPKLGTISYLNNNSLVFLFEGKTHFVSSSDESFKNHFDYLENWEEIVEKVVEKK